MIYQIYSIYCRSSVDAVVVVSERFQRFFLEVTENVDAHRSFP